MNLRLPFRLCPYNLLCESLSDPLAGHNLELLFLIASHSLALLLCDTESLQGSEGLSHHCTTSSSCRAWRRIDALCGAVGEGNLCLNAQESGATGGICGGDCFG